jgi:hypothetical protein
MIDIADINRQLVEQDTALRAELAAAAALVGDPGLRAVATMLAAGIAALHERQGNGIVLALHSAG